MIGAIDIIRCEISKYRGLAPFLAFKYINMGFPMYVTLTNIPIDNLSTVKGLIWAGLINWLNIGLTWAGFISWLNIALLRAGLILAGLILAGLILA